MLSDGLRHLRNLMSPYRETGVTFTADEVKRLTNLLDFAAAEAGNIEFRLAVFGPHIPILPVDTAGIIGRRP